jgi:hypothetical protein
LRIKPPYEKSTGSSAQAIWYETIELNGSVQLLGKLNQTPGLSRLN